MPATVREKRDHYTAFRFTDSEYAEIKARAKQRGLTMTDYVVKSCLGMIDIDPADIEQRFEQLEDRIGRLEQMAELGGY